MGEPLFDTGDKVAWDDAGLEGRVTRASECGVTVEFATRNGTKPFTFEPDGRLWEHAEKVSLRILERATSKTPSSPLHVLAIDGGYLKLFPTLEDACSHGETVIERFWGFYTRRS